MTQETKILHLLFENKVMARSQLKREVFPSVVKSRVSKVIGGLQRKKYLEARLFDTEEQNNVLIYSLTDASKSKVCQTYPVKIESEIRRSDAIAHDLTLADIRNSLETKDMIVRYIPENVLQCCVNVKDAAFIKPFAEVRSDAVVGINTKTGIIYGALEYEPSPKTSARYEKKLLEYYLRTDIRLVMYVHTHDWLIKQIRHAEEKIGQTQASKVFFANLDQILLPSKPVTFFGKDGNKFELT